MTIDFSISLVLFKNNGTHEKVQWHLKGRGHILKMNHQDGGVECYQIKRIKHDEMVLHFESETHARGIIKIIFQKIS